MKFMRELPEWKMSQEFSAKIASECSRRCLDHRVKESTLMLESAIDQLLSSPDRYKLGYGEQLCVNRCLSKLMDVKEIVDRKLKDQVELPPLLFNQNYP